MKQKIWQNRFKILTIALIASIFLQIDKVYLSAWSFSFGDLSVILSYPLYLSDILLVLLFGLTLISLRSRFKWSPWILALGGLTILGFVLNYDGAMGLNQYWLVKLLELYVLHETIKNLVKHNLIAPRDILLSFVWFSVFEALLAIVQFLLQHHVGLSFLGEPLLSAASFGVAKINLNYGLFIRSYGTFPHPNVLATFLLTGILFSFYLSDNFKKLSEFWLYRAIIIIQIFGLFLTFSRASLGTFLLSIIIIAFLVILRGNLKKELQKIVIISGLTIIVAVGSLFTLLAARSLANEPASTNLRSIYNSAGLKMIADKPIFGFGMGESMLHMQQFSRVKLDPWDVQPIHNYYLLAAAEQGIAYSLLIIAFFAYLCIKLIRLLRDKQDSMLIITLLTILFCYFALMLVDHYFYTIQQPRLLLWIVLGLSTALISSKDPTSK